MSLYNVLHGFNPQISFVLGLLRRQPDEFRRFRDAWVGEDGHLHVFTRLGGGNRECYCDEGEPHSCYQDTIAELQADPLYLRDFDDDFDYTYATFVFRVPDSASPEEREWVTRLAAIRQPSLEHKTNAALDAIKDGAPIPEPIADVMKHLAAFVSEAPR